MWYTAQVKGSQDCFLYRISLGLNPIAALQLRTILYHFVNGVGKGPPKKKVEVVIVVIGHTVGTISNKTLANDYLCV